MTKKTDKRKAQKAAALEVTRSVAPIIKSISKPGKKDGGFMKFLKGAAGVAADLVPAVLPFLLAKHGPSMGAAASAGGGAMMSSAPLAYQNTTMAGLSGVKDIRVTSRDSRGNVRGLKVTTCDLFAAIPTLSGALGEVAVDIVLSPLNPWFTGTKWQEYAQMYERYKIKRLAVIYEPVVPATTNGGAVMAIFDDPLVQVGASTNITTVQEIASQLGAESFPLWGAGCCHMMGTELLFTDPDGSDARFVAGGRFMFASASATDAVAPGNLYVIAETEYSIPSVSDNLDDGGGFSISTTANITPAAGFQLFDAPVSYNMTLSGASWYIGESVVVDGSSVTANTLHLPDGDYYASIYIYGGADIPAAGCPFFRASDAAVPYWTAIQSPANLTVSAQTSALMQQAFALTGQGETTPPVVIDWGGATSVTGARVTVVRMEEELFQGDPPFGVVADTLARSRNKKQSLFMARTSEGRQLALQRRVDAMSMQLMLAPVISPTVAEAKKKPAPVGVAYTRR